MNNQKQTKQMKTFRLSSDVCLALKKLKKKTRRSEAGVVEVAVLAMLERVEKSDIDNVLN